jgi:hypothetical protein
MSKKREDRNDTVRRNGSAQEGDDKEDIMCKGLGPFM